MVHLAAAPDEDQQAAPSAETSAPPGRTERLRAMTAAPCLSAHGDVSKRASSSLVAARQAADHDFEADTAPTLLVQASSTSATAASAMAAFTRRRSRASVALGLGSCPCRHRCP